MKTKDLATVSIICALSLVLSYFKIYTMPNGGDISLYLTPLIFYSYKSSLYNSVLSNFITALLQVLFFGFIIGGLQILLDYFIPLISISILAIINKKSIEFFIVGIIFITIISLTSYTLSGIIYFNVNISSSLIYNIIHYIPTILINSIVAYVLIINIKKNI